MSSNSTPRSSARRPRRPGDVRHDPLAIDVDTLLDDMAPARRGGTPVAPVICQELLLLRAGVDCPHCGGRTPVFSMMGLPEFEVQNAPTTLLRSIVDLPPAVDKAARSFSKGRWRNDHRSGTASGSLWLSHCARCDARLDEAFTLGPEGPFRPRLYKQRMAITMQRLAGPFVLEGARRQPNLPMLGWLEWHNERGRKARAGRTIASASAKPR